MTGSSVQALQPPAEGLSIFDMDGVFWQHGIGFVVDRRWTESHFTNGGRIERTDIALLLQAADSLPDLGAAPVASWVVARLFRLTGGRLQFETHARLRNDGGGVPVHLIAFAQGLQPLAFPFLRGHSSGVDVWGECAANVSPEQITRALVAALLEEPDQLVPCRLITIDMDPPDLRRRGQEPREVFGWNGRKFLGNRIDEEQIEAAAVGASVPAVHANGESSLTRVPLIEVSDALVPSIDGIPVTSAPSASELHAVLGPPSRCLEPKIRPPAGHRSNRLHVYDAMGLVFWEHHFTRRIESCEIFFWSDEAWIMGNQDPPNRFSGTLRIAGFTFPPDVLDVEVVMKHCAVFRDAGPASFRVTHDSYVVSLRGEGYKLPNGSRTRRQRLISVSLSWPHDPWVEPAKES